MYNINFVDESESCADDASALAEYPDVKYQTLIKRTMELKTAVSNDLVNLSGHLLAKGLISGNSKCEVTNDYTPEANRAAKLVDMIQKKVQLHHENYDEFVATLKQANSEYYKDILKILDETLREILRETLHEGNYDNSFSTIEYNSLTLQISIAN